MYALESKNIKTSSHAIASIEHIVYIINMIKTSSIECKTLEVIVALLDPRGPTLTEILYALPKTTG